MTDTDIQSKLAEYEGIVRILTTKLEEAVGEIDRLRGENSRLRTEKSTALTTLQEIYNNPQATEYNRVRAAGLALAHETPRLKSVPPALDLVAEEKPIPLAELVHLRRARQDRMERERAEERSRLVPELLPGPGRRNGNGSGDGDGDDTAG